MAIKTQKLDWEETVLNDPRYFRIVGSGVDVWVGKKNFLSTKSVQGTKIVEIESEIDYLTRPSRANMQPKVGRVAFAKMRDTFKVLLADETLSKKYILSTGFTLIEPSIDSRYLYQYLQSEDFTRQKNRYAEGSTQQAISQDDYSNIYISFPIDKKEQEKIADILGKLDKAIERTETLIKKYESMRVGAMQDLFTAKVDSKTWRTAPFSVLADAIDPQPDHRAPAEVKDGYPYVGVGDFTNGKINFESCRKVSWAAIKKQTSRFSVEEGDILFGKIGTIGQPKVFPQIKIPFALNANTILIKPKEKNSFVYWLLNSAAVLKSIEDQTNQTSQPAFGILKIRALQVFIPSNPEERTKIAQNLDVISRHIKTENEFRTKLVSLKVGLMRDLLSPMRK
jgi:type I restriction enzyme S subunit